MEIEDPGARLNDAELRELARLLARFVTHDLDQRANWRIQTSSGPVYVSISNDLWPGWPQETFTTIWPLPPRIAENRDRWTVWRQDDNGNRYEVSRHDTRAEAQSVATEMDARGHKQTYWVDPLR